jgi:predicted transglutaminase-like cysteine proteinase
MSSFKRTFDLARALAIAAAVAAASPAAAASKYKVPAHELTPAVSQPVRLDTLVPARLFSIAQILAQRAGRIDPTASVRVAAVTPSDVMPSNSASDAPIAGIPRATSTDGPFGLVELRAPEGQVWTKWRGVEADIDRDVAVMDQCRAEPARCTSPAAVRFIALIDEARKHEGRARIANVNRAVNNAVHYMSDLEQHGVVDLWSSPLDTFTTGRGDCEDYAIAKFVALTQAGVPADDLRLLLVRDQAVRQDHAVLAARLDGHWLILDNRHMQLPEDTEMWNLVPLFAIDRHGVDMFAAPYAQLKLSDID